MELNLKINDESKSGLVLSLLKELPYVEIIVKNKPLKNNNSFDRLFGIWKDKNINSKELRSRAWNRNK